MNVEFEQVLEPDKLFLLPRYPNFIRPGEEEIFKLLVKIVFDSELFSAFVTHLLSERSERDCVRKQIIETRIWSVLILQSTLNHEEEFWLYCRNRNALKLPF